MGPHDARRALGVSPDASQRDVDRAFRQLARCLHPDHGGDAGGFRELTDARRVLHGAAGHGASAHGAAHRASAHASAHDTGGGLRPPLNVIHRGPWWRRLASALAGVVRLRPPPPPRVR